MMSVCCVVVTYGDRSHLFEKVITALANQDVSRVVLVDNGASYKSKVCIEELITKMKGRLSVVHMESNTGSAYGFKTGIAEAMRFDGFEFVYLLDDDNLPADDAIAVLVRRWKMMPDYEKKRGVALLSLRRDREQFIRIANGEPVESCFAIKNSVLGFSIENFFSKVLRRMGVSRKGNGPQEMVTVPYAPYGGFFIHRSLLEKIGLPNEDLYLYHDDSEFTHRVTRQGGRIYLVKASVVADMENSWFKLPAKRILRFTYVSDGSDVRVYYGVRNRVYFYYNYLTDNKSIFAVNRCLCLAMLAVSALFSGKLKRLSLIRIAIRDGIEGNLGIKEIDFG